MFRPHDYAELITESIAVIAGGTELGQEVFEEILTRTLSTYPDGGDPPLVRRHIDGLIRAAVSGELPPPTFEAITLGGVDIPSSKMSGFSNGIRIETDGGEINLLPKGGSEFSPPRVIVGPRNVEGGTPTPLNARKELWFANIQPNGFSVNSGGVASVNATDDGIGITDFLGIAGDHIARVYADESSKPFEVRFIMGLADSHSPPEGTPVDLVGRGGIRWTAATGQGNDLALYSTDGKLNLNAPVGVEVNGATVGRKVGVPASASAAGQPGDFACDGSFAYFCIAPNTWRRVAVAAW